ncbi:SFXN3, partial [Symbiodinium necroappetens]
VIGLDGTWTMSVCLQSPFLRRSCSQEVSGMVSASPCPETLWLSLQPFAKQRTLMEPLFVFAISQGALASVLAMRIQTAATQMAVRSLKLRCFDSGAALVSSKASRALAAGAGAGAVGLALCVPPARADGASADVPAFTMEAPKYDQSTFYGRLMGMYDYIDPRTLLLTSDDLKKSQELLQKYKEAGKKPEGVSDADMWQARKNVEVSIHPVTGEELLKVGRMSAFVPMNVPLCAFMLMASSTPQILAAQWLNQTYNALNNYVNRSGATVEWSSLLQSYGLAVTASCSIALGARRLMSAVPSLQVMGPFVPYLAVISAGTANVSFTRLEEWYGKGVSIVDDEGKELGMSRAAGQMGVLQTVLSRSCFLPIAPMVMPIIGMKAIGSVAPVLTAGAMGVVTEILLITGCISGMLPVALALLPQKMEIAVSKLEPEYQNLKDSKGQPITKVFANKGL